jgi:cytochrome c oxidase cbb3-type subunit 1
MVFSIMLWMPSWGGMINGLMTLSGAWDKLRTDPIIRMMVIAVAFYGMSTFEGPMMSIKAVNSLSTTPTGPSVTCTPVRSGLGRHDLVRRALLPGAEAVEPPAALLDAPGQLALLARHARHRRLRGGSVGRRHQQGLMWREYNDQGFLVYSFAEPWRRCSPMYVLRAIGGLYRHLARLIMGWNVWMTIRGERR